MTVIGYAVITIVAASAMALTEWFQRPAWKYLLKPIAATGFVAAAWANGALEHPFGRWLLVALCLCWLGDVLLLGRRRRIFLMGLVAFLLGHLVFAGSFIVRGVSLPWLAAALGPGLVFGYLVQRWVRPHLEPAMQLPVQLYMGVAVAMGMLAISTVGAAGEWKIAVGAWLFLISDLSVAQRRFVRPGTFAWGTPVYFGAQLLLAFSV